MKTKGERAPNIQTLFCLFIHEEGGGSKSFTKSREEREWGFIPCPCFSVYTTRFCDSRVLLLVSFVCLLTFCNAFKKLHTGARDSREKEELRWENLLDCYLGKACFSFLWNCSNWAIIDLSQKWVGCWMIFHVKWCVRRLCFSGKQDPLIIAHVQHARSILWWNPHFSACHNILSAVERFHYFPSAYLIV